MSARPARHLLLVAALAATACQASLNVSATGTATVDAAGKKVAAPNASKSNAPTGTAALAAKLGHVHGFVREAEGGAPIGQAIVSAGTQSSLTGAPAEAEDPNPAGGLPPTVKHDFGDGKGAVLAEKRPRRLPLGKAEADMFVFLRKGEYFIEGVAPGELKLTASHLGRSTEKPLTVAVGNNEAELTLAAAAAPTPTPAAATASPTPGAASPTPAATGTPAAGASPTAAPTAGPTGTPAPATTATPVPATTSTPSLPGHLEYVAAPAPLSLSLKIKTDRRCGDPLNEVLYAPGDGAATATVKAVGGIVTIRELQVFVLVEGTGAGLLPPITPEIKVTLSPQKVLAAGETAAIPFSWKTDLLKNFYANPTYDGTNLIGRMVFIDQSGAQIKGPSGTRLLNDVFIQKGY